MCMHWYLCMSSLKDRHVALTARSAVNATWRAARNRGDEMSSASVLPKRHLRQLRGGIPRAKLLRESVPQRRLRSCGERMRHSDPPSLRLIPKRRFAHDPPKGLRSLGPPKGQYDSTTVCVYIIYMYNI